MTPTRTAVARPRGRPQRLPVEVTPWGSPTFDSARRVAWLLAVTRLLSPTTAPGGRQGFISAMGAHEIRLDASRLSRMESGEQHPAVKVIAGYEAVTGVPTGSLQSVSALLRRGAGLPRNLDRRSTMSTALLDETFERIDAEKATGYDWLQLARELEALDRVYLPPRTWAALSTQLVSELTRSTGIAHIRRYEAAATLLHDPAGRRYLTMGIGRFVMHPEAQSVTPALSLLQETADHPAGDLVLRLMGDESPLLRRGASGVAGALAARNGFPDGREETLERHVRAELIKRGAGARRSDAVDLASRLPEASLARIVASITDSHLRSLVVRVCSTLELVDRDVSRGVCEAIATFAEATCGRAAHDPDQMLRRLLREALFHVHRDRRQLAAVTLAASPYARPVAEAALAATTDRDAATAALLWSLLRRMGHVLTREQVAAAAYEETRPVLHAAALVTLGLATGDVPSRMADHLLATARDRAGTRMGHAATLALGMTGHRHLETLTSQAGPWSGAARWWTSVGPALHDV
jgi:hypothetical protein